MRATWSTAILAALPFFATPVLAENAVANFPQTEGQPSGKAELTATTGGVLISLEVAGLPAETWLALHIHETGQCSHSTGHDTAGGHFNPTAAEHGYLTETGPHAGDLPNIWTDAAGIARAQLFTPFVTLTEGDALIRGRALMIHAKADDYKTQPTGDAGSRLACAVIE